MTLQSDMAYFHIESEFFLTNIKAQN